MGKWLKRLFEVRKLTCTAPAKTAKTIESNEKANIAGFAGSLYQEYPEIKRLSKAADELCQAVRQARDWQDLSGILDRTQAAFEHSEVSREEAENLAILATERSRELPEWRRDIYESYQDNRFDSELEFDRELI